MRQQGPPYRAGISSAPQPKGHVRLCAPFKLNVGLPEDYLQNFSQTDLGADNPGASGLRGFDATLTG